MHHSGFLKSALVASVCVLALAAPAIAAEGRAFAIPAGDLKQALDAYVAATGAQLIYRSDDVQGVRTQGVQGSATPEQALSSLLADTSLATRYDPSGAVVIVPASAQRGQGSAAMGEQEAGQGPAASAGADDDREIVVTGSIIRGAAPSGASLIVLGREDLDNTGRGTLAEAIQTVPQVHGGGLNGATTRTGRGAAPNDFGNTGGFGTSSLNLRGLGVEETLTLVNGRRLAPAGQFGAIADISALPMAAVERVEILADGASATYGADAMAGVVNIIMNRRFDGAETRLRVGLETRSGQPELQASQTFGWAFDRGNLLLSADYARRDGITAKGRPYAASQDLRPYGGIDNRHYSCSPGNIVSPSPPELWGAIPTGQDGTALTPDQIRRGETNRCEPYADSSHVTPETEKGSVYFAGSYDITERLRLSADVIVAQRSTTRIGAYRTSPLTVPVSNAYRQMNGLHGDTAPLNQPIEIEYMFTEVDPDTYNEDVWSLLASVGADYSLGGDWQLSLTGSYGRYSHKSDIRTPDRDRLAQALASSDPATAFNPFGDGSANSRSLVESLFYLSRDLQESDYRAASLSFNGSLLDMPGGAMKLAVGGDYRRESFGFRTRSFYPGLAPGFQESNASDADREVTAAYAELFIPLFSEANAVAGAQRLSLSLSSRYDHYSDFGNTFNPKAGVAWVPVDGLTFRGSYGTSFKAPLLQSLYGEAYASVSPLHGGAKAPDVDGDGFTNTLLAFGGNPDLGPEEGKSWTTGVEIEPEAIPGLRLHATYFNLRFTGRFASASNWPLVFSDPAAYQDIVYFPLPPQSEVDRLIASVDQVLGIVPPPGSVEAIIDTRTMNFALQVMDGIDAGASYTWEALSGTFNLSADVSYLSRYKSRMGQSVTETSYLGNVGLPVHWKGRGGIGWSNNSLILNGWVNHVGSYTNKLVDPHEPVDSYTTVDLSLQAKLGAGASLAFYVTNLLDEAPPFVNYGAGYDGANADPVGRRIAVQLTKRW